MKWEVLGVGWDGNNFTLVVQEGPHTMVTVEQSPLEGGEGVSHAIVWEEGVGRGRARAKALRQEGAGHIPGTAKKTEGLEGSHPSGQW